MATARALALPASTLSSSRFQIKLFKDPTCQNRMLLLACHYNHRASGTYSLKLQTRAEFSVSHKVKMQMTKVKERLLEDVPDFMKDFPWKKAEDMVLHKFLFLGQKALKWSFLTLFIFSSLSDIIFAISRNKELMIPLGLFAGCMLADFLKEISQELVDNSEERALKQQFAGIGCFFVLVKFIATYSVLRGQVFLLHVANGGLMQVLWLWKCLLEERNRVNGENSFSSHNAPMTTDVEN
ncbi:uncharacterized protein LOC131161944 isoform X2 [Malania oleifera]|uniref:uncharacterized protein LOC131161944 isoform X2 n=1 Tax=Malania oleifera TaxID=397392 RepID=UPI0025AE592A|nr:uncharacterized protein LOC131161944 isoform X2 [Malania oleifera]